MIGFGNLTKWFKSTDTALLKFGRSNTLVLIVEDDIKRLQNGEVISIMIGDTEQAITIAHADKHLLGMR